MTKAAAKVEANPALIERITQHAVGARQNNEATEFIDGQNRVWFIAPETVDNHSKVLIQVRRGETLREAYLGTQDFTPEAASSAAHELHGALQ